MARRAGWPAVVVFVALAPGLPLAAIVVGVAGLVWVIEALIAAIRRPPEP